MAAMASKASGDCAELTTIPCGLIMPAFSVAIWVRGFPRDRKSTRLNSSHLVISYAVFCLKKNISCRAKAFRRGRFGRQVLGAGVIIDRDDEAEAKEKALAEHVARRPEDVGRTVEDFNWIL